MSSSGITAFQIFSRPFCALIALAFVVSACDVSSVRTEYSVVYAVKGPRKGGMMITMATPSGTEQHQVAEGYVSLPYTFRSGQSAYISAQNLSNRGELTVILRWSRLGSDKSGKSGRLESTSTGSGSIATVSWLVGDESAQGGF